jgi:hypothetical protein
MPMRSIVSTVSLEAQAAAPRLRLELGGHIVIECEGGSHIMRLLMSDHDVKLVAQDGRARRGSGAAKARAE